jgi:hypothetical protein
MLIIRLWWHQRNVRYTPYGHTTPLEIEVAVMVKQTENM